MMEPTAGGQPDARALEIYERIAPSLVDIHVKGGEGGGDLHTLGLAVERGGVTAWKGLMSAGDDDWENLETIAIRQGTQAWVAGLHSMRADWGLCALAVRGAFSLPLISWRRSRSLAMGDRLLYAVAVPGDSRPRLGWCQLIDVGVCERKAYGGVFIWTARLDPTMPREYAFAFDAYGCVVGLLEPFPDIPSLGALLAGEWVGGLVQGCWLDMLMKVRPEQIVEEYREAPESFGAEALCAIGRVLLMKGDSKGCVQAWRAAIAKDPLNPWTYRALGSVLTTNDRIDEAGPLLARAAQLEAQEPEELPMEEEQ